MFERSFVTNGHLYRVAVKPASVGWEVCEERDHVVVHRAHHDRWHRVELAIRLFEYAISTKGDDAGPASEPVIV